MHKGVAKVIATIAKAVSKKVNNSTPKTNLKSTHGSSQPAKGKVPGK